MIVIYWVLPYFPETFNFMTKIVINIDFVGIYEKAELDNIKQIIQNMNKKWAIKFIYIILK